MKRRLFVISRYATSNICAIRNLLGSTLRLLKEDLAKESARMGDLRGGLVGLGPMHGVRDLTFKFSDSAGSAACGPSHGAVTRARAAPATAASRVGSDLGLAT
jgi:hypothetical protein